MKSSYPSSTSVCKLSMVCLCLVSTFRVNAMFAFSVKLESKTSCFHKVACLGPYTIDRNTMGTM
jgi:hypothetical protein